MSSTRFNRRGGTQCLALAILIVACLPAMAAAQNHDLMMLSLSASPNPLQRGCQASLSASFIVNGAEDHTLGTTSTATSPLAQIHFYWADGTQPLPSSPGGWTLAGTLPVTWEAGDGPFAIGREWPNQFPSASGAAVSWTVPSSGSDFHLRAEVEYTGETDDNPANNSIVATVGSVDGSCGGGGLNCVKWSSTLWLCPKFPGRGFDPELHCVIRGDCVPELDLCRVVGCPVCMTGLSCPPEPWEILVDLPMEKVRLTILDQRGRQVAHSRPVRDPNLKGQQVLRFKPEKGVRYQVQIEDQGLEPGETLSIRSQLRRPRSDRQPYTKSPPRTQRIEVPGIRVAAPSLEPGMVVRPGHPLSVATEDQR